MHRAKGDGDILMWRNSSAHSLIREKRKLTHLKTSETGTIYSERLSAVLSFVLNGDFHKNEAQHIAHVFKRETQFLLPNGVEAIVLHNTRLVGESTGRGRP